MSQTEKPNAPKPSETDMFAACKWYRELYNKCFNRWYRFQFLQGKRQRDCDQYFDDYQACIKEELAKHGIGEDIDFDDKIHKGVEPKT